MAAEGGENDNGGSDENVTRSIAVRCVKHSDQFLFLDMILILFLLLMYRNRETRLCLNICKNSGPKA